MANDSTTSGPLTPITPLGMMTLEGTALEDFLHDFIVGLTGLANEVVIPAWQPEPPNIPSGSWCSFKLLDFQMDTNPAIIHHPDVNGFDEFRRHRTFQLSMSFYGSNAEMLAQQMADGVVVSQNHDILAVQGIGYVEAGQIILVPSLVKQRWLRRADINIKLKQQIVRTYGVDSLTSAEIQLNNEHYVETINVTGP